MEIQFDTTLDDLTEHRYRLFIRKSSYQKNKWLGVVGPFLGVGIVFVVLKYVIAVDLPGWLPVLLGAVGAIAYLVFYPEITRSNIKKYLAKTVQDELPWPTTYRIDDGQISGGSSNKEISFKLSELDNIKEDQRAIELSFGAKGLLVIPVRAFDSTDEIDQLKKMLQSEYAPGG